MRLSSEVRVVRYLGLIAFLFLVMAILAYITSFGWVPVSGH